jgi:ketosteroid isomerase-like protein
VSEAREVVAEFNRCWEAADLESCTRLIAADCVFILHVAADLVEHAGQWNGREQIRLALAAARQHYDYILYRPQIMGADEQTVRVRVEFIGTHRATGARIEMIFRQVFTVAADLISRCEEYHDRAKLEAYLRLIQQYPLPQPTGV